MALYKYVYDDIATLFDMEKLEWCGYPTVQKI